MSAPSFPYQQIAPRVRAVLGKAFNEAGIFLSEGYLGRIHVKIVDHAFDNLSPSDRQATVYDVIRAELGADSQAVTFVTAISPNDI